MVLPSGAGKTVCALRAAEALRSQLRIWSEEECKVKKVSALSDEEVARLEAVGVVWQPRRAGAA